jgi:hypothetical protein
VEERALDVRFLGLVAGGMEKVSFEMSDCYLRSGLEVYSDLCISLFIRPTSCSRCLSSS